jgi:hypothetical protein
MSTNISNKEQRSIPSLQSKDLKDAMGKFPAKMLGF